MSSVCIESTLDVYRNDFTCVSKRLRFVSKRLVSKRVVSKRLCIETTGYHLGYNGTSNSSRVNLQPLKSYKDVSGHEESVSWL